MFNALSAMVESHVARADKAELLSAKMGLFLPATSELQVAMAIGNACNSASEACCLRGSQFGSSSHVTSHEQSSSLGVCAHAQPACLLVGHCCRCEPFVAHLCRAVGVQNKWRGFDALEAHGAGRTLSRNKPTSQHKNGCEVRASNLAEERGRHEVRLTDDASRVARGADAVPKGCRRIRR